MGSVRERLDQRRESKRAKRRSPIRVCETRGDVIVGVHAIVFSNDAEADRAFFRDVLGFGSVDAGGGWLIFELPPAELAAHPDDRGDRYELYLMCDDVNATVAELRAKGAQFEGEVTDQGWGLVTTIRLPGGGRLGLYEPRHPSPAD
jgi:catechol 2,3-dioxygenase-like lactoylglutathione lyase family enzyme